jgi:tetratricopeptide (TPR) repeat protein
MLCLADKDYPQAEIHFKAAIELYQVLSDDEQIAWTQALLARALLGLGDREEAHQFLMEALWTSIEIQGFIPLLFTLPVILLYLDQEDPSQAARLYQHIRVSNFLANARFFKDIVFRFLSVGVTSSQEEAPPHPDLKRDLWATAASVISTWVQAWMEEKENVTRFLE